MPSSEPLKVNDAVLVPYLKRGIRRHRILRVLYIAEGIGYVEPSFACSGIVGLDQLGDWKKVGRFVRTWRSFLGAEPRWKCVPDGLRSSDFLKDLEKLGAQLAREADFKAKDVIVLPPAPELATEPEADPPLSKPDGASSVEEVFQFMAALPPKRRIIKEDDDN